MVEGGATPVTDAQDLQDKGFDIAIFPGGIVRALAHAGQAYYQSLAAAGTTALFRDQMFDFDGLNRVIGTPEMLEAGARYDPTSED